MVTYQQIQLALTLCVETKKDKSRYDTEHDNDTR